MTRQIVLHRPPILAKQQSTDSTRSNQKLRFAEVAGGTAAECAAVCCCCPCGLVNLLILAMYKVPAGLCRKVLKMKKKKKKKKEQSLTNELLPQQRRRCTCGCKDAEVVQLQPVSVDLRPLDKSDKDDDDPTAKEVLELEKEMLARFYSTGFWRSPSQRE